MQQTGAKVDATGSDGENVLSLKEARKTTVAGVIGEIRAYWEALRAGRAVPLRSEVDPRGIERALEFAFVLERVAPGVARFRLAGMHLTDLMGMEVRGMPVTSFFAPQARHKVADLIEAAFQGPEVVELLLTAESGIGKPGLTARMVILPLKSDLGDVSRALGCLYAEGEIGRTPRRFEVTEAKTARAVPGHEARPEMPAPAAVPGFAERAPDFTPAPGVMGHRPVRQTGKRGAYLRLVKSDD